MTPLGQLKDKDRKEGFYKVQVREHGNPFYTIGLWRRYYKDQGAWLFAQGDGDEQGAGFTVLAVDEEDLLCPEYVYGDDTATLVTTSVKEILSSTETCDVCGGTVDKSNLTSVLLHQHKDGEDSLAYAASMLGVKGNRVR